MTRVRAAALALMLGGTLATGAAAQDDSAALRRAAVLGDRIYGYDQAAWISTDALLKMARDPRAIGVSGWIVEEQSDHLHVTYYRSDGDQRTAVFTAEVRGGTVLASHRLAASDDSHLTPVERRMIQARETATRESFQPCTSGPMNVVVLPPATENGPISVYVLTAQVKPGEFPFGGHFVVDVGADGKILSKRAFTKACLNMPKPPESKDGRPAFVVVTHLLDTTPTEIHVFLSRWMNAPVVVLSPTENPPTKAHRTWIVNGDDISLARTDP